MLRICGGRADARDGRTEMRGGIVPELGHARMAFERGLHDAALHATASSVNQTDVLEACRGCGIDVLSNHGRNVARREGMEIELALDRHANEASHEPPGVKDRWR